MRGRVLRVSTCASLPRLASPVCSEAGSSTEVLATILSRDPSHAPSLPRPHPSSHTHLSPTHTPFLPTLSRSSPCFPPDRPKNLRWCPDTLDFEVLACRETSCLLFVLILNTVLRRFSEEEKQVQLGRKQQNSEFSERSLPLTTKRTRGLRRKVIMLIMLRRVSSVSTTPEKQNLK